MKHNCSDPHSWYKTAFGLQLPNKKKHSGRCLHAFTFMEKLNLLKFIFASFKTLSTSLAPNKAANKMLNLKSVVSDLMFPSNFCPSLVLDFLVFLYRMSRCHSAPTRHNSNF